MKCQCGSNNVNHCFEHDRSKCDKCLEWKDNTFQYFGFSGQEWAEVRCKECWFDHIKEIYNLIGLE